MTRAAVFGPPELTESALALGLAVVDRDPELVLVDLRVPSAVSDATAIPVDVPRVVIAGDFEGALLRAAGVGDIARSLEPAAIGPLVAARLPRRVRGATRIVMATALRGGVGRTLLVANLAARLARRLPVCAIDATGTGALGWWLRADVRPWGELEGLASELAPEHLRIVAGAPRDQLRVLGGGPIAPSPDLLAAVTRAAVALGDLVLIDAPPLADERTRGVAPDRRLVLVYDDPPSLAALASSSLAEDDWLIASQSKARELAGRRTFRALPRDERAVAEALAGPNALRGQLGAAYDELAELLSIDAT